MKLLFLFWFAAVTCGDSGDDCQLQSGEKGKCIPIHQCPSAVELLHRGTYPITCGFEGNTAIVCCGEKLAAEYSTGVSEQKCQEYYSGEQNVTRPKVKDSLIIIGGGVDALEAEFPSMAALGYGTTKNTRWLCGGSLISPNFILTAAHCTHSREYGPVRYARMGVLNLKKITDNLQDFLVTDITKHPDYKPPALYNDIALLKLNKDADFTDYVKPVCLYYKHDLPQQSAVAIGWGKTQFNEEASDILQKVELAYFSNEKCKSSFSTVSKLKLPHGIDDQSHICAGGTTEEKDTCQGDSGGPLQSKLESGPNKPFYIVGITSFGKACGIANAPAVYTKVSHYVPWIERIVWS